MIFIHSKTSQKINPVIVLLFSYCIFSCTTQKNAVKTPLKCFENGSCTSEKYDNTTLVIKRDEIGKWYHQMDKDQGKTTFVYYYQRNKNKEYADGHYTEEVLFEVNDSVFNKNFNNLKPNKILFGVFCYCKDLAGYYPIKNASISYDKKSKIIQLTFDKVVEHQVLETIEMVKNQI